MRQGLEASMLTYFAGIDREPDMHKFFLFTHTYGGFCAELFEAPERRGDSLFRLLPLLVLP